MGGVAIHVPEVEGSAPVGHEHSDLVHALGDQAPEVPHHVGAFEVGLRVALLGVDEVRELLGVPDEEDGRVVAGHVPVALLGVELDGEASGVSFRVSRALLASNSGESGEDGRPFAYGLERFGLGPLGAVGSALEVAVCAGPFCVDHTFGDPFSVEMGELVNEVEIL